MELLDFDPKERLSKPDQDRLERVAAANDMTPADYVERVLKRAIFVDSEPLRLPNRPAPAA